MICTFHLLMVLFSCFKSSLSLLPALLRSHETFLCKIYLCIHHAYFLIIELIFNRHLITARKIFPNFSEWLFLDYFYIHLKSRCFNIFKVWNKVHPFKMRSFFVWNHKRINCFVRQDIFFPFLAYQTLRNYWITSRSFYPFIFDS